MKRHQKQFKVVVLAAGKGKRMKLKQSKVLQKVDGVSIIRRLVSAIIASGLDAKPTVVVGKDRTNVRRELKNQVDYVTQQQQLGTGHAVKTARPLLKGKSHYLAVLYGDHPFITARTLQKLAAMSKGRATIIMMTVTLPHFRPPYHLFYDMGRIKRDRYGHLEAIIEYRNANEKEREIREVNPAMYCFASPWLWRTIHQLDNHNAQKEYLLTDLLNLAFREKKRIITLPISPKEALGVNNPAQLRLARKITRRDFSSK